MEFGDQTKYWSFKLLIDTVYIRNKYIKTTRRYFAICNRVLHAHFMHNRRVYQFQIKKQKHKIKFLIIAVIWMRSIIISKWIFVLVGLFVHSPPLIRRKKNCQSSCDCFNLLSVFANLKPQLKFWYVPMMSQHRGCYSFWRYHAPKISTKKVGIKLWTREKNQNNVRKEKNRSLIQMLQIVNTNWNQSDELCIFAVDLDI